MNNLNNKFKELVKSHGLELLRENPEKLEDRDDLHNFLFNEDYFVIGYFEATEILKKCDYCAFDAISDLVELEELYFGESKKLAEDISGEKVVNSLAYFYGLEVIDDIIKEFEE